jgi:segregation and condensation protein B
MELSARIEALLYWKQEPMKIGEVSARLGVNEGATIEGIASLRDALKNRGIALVEHNGEVSLATAPEAHADIEAMVTEELSKELGKASMETLAIILYSGGMTRGEIEYVRGVNSSHALRHLQMRGLAERYTDPSDERKTRYRVTVDALRHLGVRSIEDIPGYEEARAKVTAASMGSNEEN